MKPLVRTVLIFSGALVLGMILAAPNTRAATPLARAGSLIKFNTDPRVYVVKDGQGTLEWIRTEADFRQRGYSFSDVKQLPDSQLSSYSIQQAPDIQNQITHADVQMAPQGPMVVVVDNGRVVTDQSANAQWSAASITKLMSALVLNDLGLDWNASVAMAKEDEVGGARLRVAVGSHYRRIDLQHASLMGSANNSTHTLARTSGISMDEFVARMNVKARELGMNDSHFVDPTGLDPNNVSTAADIAKLIEAANKVPRIAEIGKKTSYTLVSTDKKHVKHVIGTTNALLKAGDPVGLGKTGYLEESRYNFTVTAEGPAGQDRTVVVLNAPTQASAYSLAKKYVYAD